MAIEALYIHIPFCRSKCLYCDFDSSALCGADRGVAAMGKYLDALLARLDAFGRAGALANVKTVYIGGGTPTVLGPSLVQLASAVYRYCKPVEFTCEANPESFDARLARVLKDAGVTRISLGVQSLLDDELKRIGRIHSSQQALDAVTCAKEAGLQVCCDLMCGLPNQSMDTWKATVETLLKASPDHISVYPLSIEEGTGLYRLIECGELEEPDGDLQADEMEWARARFAQDGFLPYEVASYAKPERACRHNIAYWTGVEYLGIGRSAASMLSAQTFTALGDFFNGRAAFNADSARIRIVQVDDAGEAFDFEGLSAREAAAEDLMLACRMTCGIPEALLRRAELVIPAAELESACERAVSQGLAEWKLDDSGHTANHMVADESPRHLAPTAKGWLEGNLLFGLFWDLAG